jgi:hypothetical protein
MGLLDEKQNRDSQKCFEIDEKLCEQLRHILGERLHQMPHFWMLWDDVGSHTILMQHAGTGGSNRSDNGSTL